MIFHHKNNGSCPKCFQLLNRYPPKSKKLFNWFFELQEKNPDAHVSCGGRGREAQNELFLKKATRAQWGESAHNYNCAIDIFEQTEDGKYQLDKVWFARVLGELPRWLMWYGKPDSKFYELPHVELKHWREIVDAGYEEIIE